GLADTLPADGEVQLNGKTMTKRNLYLLAIEIDPGNYAAYVSYGDSLPDDGEILYGVTLKQECYLKAIHLNPYHFAAYLRLGDTLPNKKGVQLKGGATLTNKDLYRRAIQYNPKHFAAYVALADTLSDNDSIYLASGENITKEELYRRARELNPQHFGGAITQNANDLAMQDFADRPVPPKDKGDVGSPDLAAEPIPESRSEAASLSDLESGG
ncbi:MAG TPA: hypothetical protein VIJ46_04095, partial [Rhabdochlamydiaceae bacterium]